MTKQLSIIKHFKIVINYLSLEFPLHDNVDKLLKSVYETFMLYSIWDSLTQA